MWKPILTVGVLIAALSGLSAAEHTIDLESEFILDASVYHANQADSATLLESLTSAQENLQAAEVYRDIEEVVADKGYHKNETLADCRDWGLFGLRTYIPEPNSPYERRWTDKPPEFKEAVYANRRRLKGDRNKRLQKKRSEFVERSFAHVCRTGGARGCEASRKRTNATKSTSPPATWVCSCARCSGSASRAAARAVLCLSISSRLPSGPTEMS